MNTLRTVPCQVKNIKTLARTFPTIVCVLTRSCNENVVVYEANVDDAGNFDRKEPIIGYWLDLEPKLRSKRRRAGIQHDYEELTLLEKRLAYGVKCSIINPRKIKVVFKIPNFQVIVQSNPVTRTATAYIDNIPIRSAHIIVNPSFTFKRKLIKAIVEYQNGSKKCIFPVAKKT